MMGLISNRWRHFGGGVALLVLVWMALPSTANAYIDPGTGSMVLQLLLASVLGAAYALKSYWRRIRGWLTGRRADATQSDDPAHTERHD